METNDPVARALVLFDRYAEMPHAALSVALAELRQQDADACMELLRMLAADEQTHSFASPLQWFNAHSDTAPDAERGADRIWADGTRLGPWCVDGIIGLGGMGVVYAAHRADGMYEREVALKTIRTEIMSPALQQAFAKERSHLARLDHPSIVALHDAGVAEGGQPWIAMQRVHGDSIDRWCDAHASDLRMRVRLLIETCNAIAYAHAHGVLHQDIKPSNVLVTDDGHVKLLDFGLSAILTPHGEKSFARIGVSSAYAAPEVFEGASPSVAIDVYALGVVLYRLLCDGWPRRPRMATAIPQTRSETPRAPSALAAEAPPESLKVRAVRDGQALSRALRPDLDAIALRCVEQNPVDRYASMTEISADLRAWLERRPVAASNGGWTYRATRFVRRNALAVGAVAMLGLASAGGGWVAFEQQQRARMEAENGEILNQLFEKSIGVAALSSLDSTPLSSQALLDDAERQLREAAGADRSQFLARGLGALARAWLVRADYAKAERLLKESKALGADNPLQAARTNAVLAQLFNLRTNSVEAERLVREGLDVLPAMDGPEDELVGLDLRMQRARARWVMGDTRGAIAVLDSAVLLAERLGDDGVPALAELLGQRGYASIQLFQFESAEKDLRRSLSIIGVRNPITANTARRYLANLLIMTDRRDEASRLALESYNSNLRIFGSSHPETGRALITLGKAWYYLGRSDRAKDAIDKAVAILGVKTGARHPDLADAYVIRHAMYFDAGKLEEAIVEARRSVDILAQAYGPRHEATLKRTADLGLLLIFYGNGLDEEKKTRYFREAQTLLADALKTGERQGLPMAYARDEYATILAYFNRLDEAEEQALRGIREMGELFGEDNDDYLTPARMSLMRVRTAQGRYAEAEEIGLRNLAQTVPESQAPFEQYLSLELLLDNEIARGSQTGIRKYYARIKGVADRNDLMDRLAVKRIPGINAPIPVERAQTKRP